MAGLVIHGGLQGWWLQPVLGQLGEVPLFVGATILTAFNDNALITYLATLVPGFSEELKFAVVSGAVTGGGLTVIANAPNPAGQSILQRFFPTAFLHGDFFSVRSCRRSSSRFRLWCCEPIGSAPLASAPRNLPAIDPFALVLRSIAGALDVRPTLSPMKIRLYLAAVLSWARLSSTLPTASWS